MSIFKNTYKSQGEQKKQNIQSDGEESISLQIQPQKKQMTAHTDFDIKYEEDERKIVFYIELDPKNINNLTKEFNKAKQFEDERKYYKNCIFIKKIQTPQTQIKGNFRISYLHYKGMTFSVQFKNNANNQQMEERLQLEQLFGKMKMHIKGSENWEPRWVSCQKKDQSIKNCFNFEIETSELQKILKQKLLLQIVFQKYPKLSKDYLGIQNEGNTCYANSTLQVLFHFMPLRKMIVQLSSKKVKKLTKALQQIFIDLMTSKSAVRAQSLLNCFDKLGLFPHRQQDIHEFLISFFDELQNQLPEVAHFWTGKDFQVTFSKQVKYQTKQQQNFTELQLFMSDTKGNNFASISQSLRQLLNEDMADQPIDTDQFGKIRVLKSRYFQSLPPLLFMNIKRYQYNAKRKELKKINLDLTYPKQVKLDFLMKTPEDLNYILYAVVVHKGRTPNSGHYFCFVNVSKEVDNSIWYEFNDSTVKSAKENKVLNNFTGKKKSEIFLNQEYGKWVERDQPSQETAYLLTYIRKDLFQDFQNVEVKIPTWHLQRLQQKLTEQQARTMTTVRIFILNNTNQFKPFDQSVQLQELKLLKSETIQSQLKKYQKHLCCTIGTIWKVNCKTRTIKHIQRDYGQQCKITVARHTQFKRGIRQPDYFMIVPLEKMNQVEEFQKRQLGIIHTSEMTQQEITQKVEVLAKEDILRRIEEQKKESANISYEADDMQYFINGWNGYLHVQKQ